MYLYFDKNGKLKEIINDEALRQGNYGTNKMYIYIEDRSYSSIDVTYLLPSGSTIGPDNHNSFVNDEYIPFNPKRDLKYFKYDQEYRFCVITIQDEQPPSADPLDIVGTGPLDEAGLVHASLNAILTGGDQLQLGDVNFNVETNYPYKNRVVPDVYLSLSNYQFLRKLYDNLNPENFVNNANVDFYLVGTGFRSTLTDEEFSKLNDAMVIYDYTVSNNRGPIYFYKAVNNTYQGSGYKYFRINNNLLQTLWIKQENETHEIVLQEYDLNDYYTQTQVNNLLLALQPKIDSDHKLSSDLVDDENKTNRFTRFLALLSETGTITEQNQSSINQAGLILVYPLHNPSYFRFLKQDDTYYYYAKTPELTKSTANDSLSTQYIRINKSTYAYEVVTVTDDFYNKTQLDNKGFITKAVDDLTNYYDKSTSDGKYALITETGNKILLEIDSSTFKIKAKLYDKNNVLISTSNEIDLPLESVVVSGSYDSATKKVILTLQNGSTIEFSVADLVSGLQPTIDSSHKLSADLVNDSNSINKFVTVSDKQNWNSKANGKRFIDLSTYEFSADLSLTTLLTAIENIVGTLTVGTTYGFSVAFEDLIANMQILNGGAGSNSYWTIITRGMELSISGEGALSTIINNKTLGDMTTLLFATTDQLDSNLALVELTGSGGTLTDAQYDLVANAKSCIIERNGSYYTKRSDDNGILTYQCESQTNLGTSAMLSQGRITINKSTKAWGTDSASVEVWKKGQVYSKTQVDEMVADLETADEDITDTVSYKISGASDGLALPSKSQEELLEVKGNSKVCSNLFSFNKVTLVAESVSYTINNDNSITITNNSSLLGRVLISDMPQKQYTLSFDSNNANGKFQIFAQSLESPYVVGNNVISFNYTTTGAWSFYVSAGYSITISNVMLNEGSTALPYEPYFEGIKNSNGKLIATGRNLLNLNDFYNDATDHLDMTNGVYLGVGTYTLKLLNNVWAGITSSNGTATITSGYSNQKAIEVTVAGTFKIQLSASGISPTNLKTNYQPMLNYGSTALPFEDFTQHEITLPELKSAGSVSDTIKAGKKIVKVKSICLNDYSPSNFTGNSIIFSLDSVFNGIMSRGTNETGYIISNNYQDVKWSALDNNTFVEGCMTYASNTGQFRIYGTSISDIKPNTIINFALATPIEEDYTEPLYLTVYNNGSEQQTSQVPYTITHNYDISIKDQVLTNVRVDQKQEDEIQSRAKYSDIEPVLLWENASPDVDFASGEVLSNVSQLSYKYLVFEFAMVKDNLAITEMVKIKLNNLTANGDFAYSKYINLETDTITRNIAFISSDNKIYVSDATDTSNNTDNNYLIPIAIYGTNIL